MSISQPEHVKVKFKGDVHSKTLNQCEKFFNSVTFDQFDLFTTILFLLTSAKLILKMATKTTKMAVCIRISIPLKQENKMIIQKTSLACNIELGRRLCMILNVKGNFLQSIIAARKYELQISPTMVIRRFLHNHCDPLISKA